MPAVENTTRFLELADRFDQLAANERDPDLRREYARRGTQLRQMASARILMDGTGGNPSD